MTKSKSEMRRLALMNKDLPKQKPKSFTDELADEIKTFRELMQLNIDLEAKLKLAVEALEFYADLDAEIIKKDKLDQWLDDSRSNPGNFISGNLYVFGLTKGFAQQALNKIKGSDND